MKHKIIAHLQELTEAWKAQFDNPPAIPLIWSLQDERLIFLDDVFVTSADAIDPEDICFDVELWQIGLNDGSVDVVIDWPYEGEAKFSVVQHGSIPVMDVKSMTTEDLQAYLEAQLKEDSQDFHLPNCLAAMGELKLRKGELQTPEQQLKWKMTLEYYYPWSLRDDEELIDPTGTKLTPSWHGENCQGNGQHPGVECCCDECDHFQACFPDYAPGKIWDETTERYI